jgi:hypothetical protein
MVMARGLKLSVRCPFPACTATPYIPFFSRSIRAVSLPVQLELVGSLSNAAKVECTLLLATTEIRIQGKTMTALIRYMV